jgi:2-amino-4-hydroxy-6-hydroxymethyldihydropteridine diphosphokinase
MERTRPTESGADEGSLEATAAFGPPDPASLAFVALGSNLGDREAALRSAVAAVGARAPVAAASWVYEADAHTLPGQTPQPPFLNAVVAISQTLEPRPLLEALLEIETGLGRRREGARWAARSIDLDLLLFGNRTIDEPGLVVPHPRLAERRFVLQPLSDLAPDFVVPGAGRTVAELLATCADDGRVERTDIVLR